MLKNASHSAPLTLSWVRDALRMLTAPFSHTKMPDTKVAAMPARTSDFLTSDILTSPKNTAGCCDTDDIRDAYTRIHAAYFSEGTLWNVLQHRMPGVGRRHQLTLDIRDLVIADLAERETRHQRVSHLHIHLQICVREARVRTHIEQPCWCRL